MVIVTVWDQILMVWFSLFSVVYAAWVHSHRNSQATTVTYGEQRVMKLIRFAAVCFLTLGFRITHRLSRLTQNIKYDNTNNPAWLLPVQKQAQTL